MVCQEEHMIKSFSKVISVMNKNKMGGFLVGFEPYLF
jgi:hypothetical protein